MHHVGDQISIGQHRAFRDTGGAAGILQSDGVVGAGLERFDGKVSALFQGCFEINRVGKVVFRHHLFDVPNYEVDNPAFETEHFANAGDDDGFDLGVADDLFQIGSKVFDNNNGLHTRIHELVAHFARGVKWVGIH